MSDQEIIKAVAELDGLSHVEVVNAFRGEGPELPDYLTSRDAILATCEKQPESIRLKIIARTNIFTTAKEICVILLEECGKIIDR